MSMRARLTRDLEALWTTEKLARTFQVSPMTLWVWRTKRGLPQLELPGRKRPAVRFIPEEVRRWAKDNKVKMYG